MTLPPPLLRALPFPDRAQGGARNRQPNKIVLFTAIFGPAHNASHLPYFFKSAESSGFDIIVIGDPPVPFELPHNVRQVHIKWKEFARLVSAKLFNGERLKNLENTVFYKVIDFKPMFGFLFQDLIENHHFWGYCDNDMLLGQASSFLTDDMLSKYDIITAYEGPNGEKTWGPFTLMRNVKKTNELFRLTKFGIRDLIDSYTTYFFDEWGGGNWMYYNRSMTQIITEHGMRLGLRWHGGFPIGWDGECQHIDKPKCSECVLTTEDYANHLTWNRTLINPQEKYGMYEVLLCHFQFGKKQIKEQMTMLSAAKQAQLLAAEPFYYSYPEGFRSK